MSISELSSHNQAFFVTAARGLEPFVLAELSALNISAKVQASGVACEGDLTQIYQVLLWSRCAGRVLLPLAHGEITQTADYYDLAMSVEWTQHFDVACTFAIAVTAQRSAENTLFIAQTLKDAVVDQFRDRIGQRPTVSKDQPDIRIHAHLDQTELTLYLDLSGESLHRRGYRIEQGIAPLKEHLAAALLYKAGWTEAMKQNHYFYDPFCGSGTLPIEAWMMATDHAPALKRKHWGFDAWLGHQPQLWETQIELAQTRHQQGLAQWQGRIFASDYDSRMLAIAQTNAQRIGATIAFAHLGIQQVDKNDFIDETNPEKQLTGLLLTNPPYGERLTGDITGLYATLGDVLKQQFVGWQVAVLTGDAELTRRMGLRAHKVNAFFNGALPCKLVQFSITESQFVDREAADARAQQRKMDTLFAGGGDAFFNRFKKNIKHLEGWAKRENVSAYRLYDADLPDFNLAVDRYASTIVVQEYAAPSSIDPHKAQARLQQAIMLIAHALAIKEDEIVLKVRERQRGHAQYEKQDAQGHTLTVNEGKVRLWVNLTDYLDTGLFLDHRNVRLMIAKEAAQKRFLNLFAYTGSASVHAAQAGAITTTVDMSRTYLDWAMRNFELNHIAPQLPHRFICSDVMSWLTEMNNDEATSNRKPRWDLIFLDPPTFSNSKKMLDVFDIQRDHVQLITQTLMLLAEGGQLIFSTNHRRFKLDNEAFSGWKIEDISRKTLPKDFEKNPKIRQCWRFS